MSIWSIESLAPGAEAPTQDPAAELAALREGRGVLRRSPEDRIDLVGPDGADLLHRLSATALDQLEPGQAVRAIFTDDKGHLVDVPLVCATGDAIVLLCGPGRGPALLAWVERFLIAEDVTITASSGRFALGLVGETAMEVAADALDQLATAEDPDEVSDLFLAADSALGPVMGYLEVPGDRADQLLVSLEGSELVPVGQRALAAWSIDRGWALPGPALASGPNPLEVGLKHLVSFTKGCYVGQEVVARLDTYEKVRRRVAVAEGPAPAPAGSTVTQQEKKVGVVLASTVAIDEDGALALLLIDKTVMGGSTVELVTGAATLRRDPPPPITPA